jgi:hypothetical protein
MFFNILRVFTTYLLPFMINFLKKLGNLLKYCEVQFILPRLVIIIYFIIIVHYILYSSSIFYYYKTLKTLP